MEQAPQENMPATRAGQSDGSTVAPSALVPQWTTAYLFLAVMGCVVPAFAFVPWVAAHGLDVQRLVAEMFASRVAAFFSLDVLVSAVVVVTLCVDGRRRGVPHTVYAIVGTCVVGVSLGLPLYLFFSSRHAQRLATRERAVASAGETKALHN